MTQDPPSHLPPAEIEAMFGGPGAFRFARWRRPVVPVIFGASDESLPALKGGIEAVTALAGHPMGETDPEMGANLFVFFLRDWQELAAIPGLEDLVPGILARLPRLEAAAARQYRQFRFEPDGAIRAAFSFLHMGSPLADLAAEDLALDLGVKSLLLWSESAFAGRPSLQAGAGGNIVQAQIASLLRAAYDPVLPASSRDPVLALRLAARL